MEPWKAWRFRSVPVGRVKPITELQCCSSSACMSKKPPAQSNWGGNEKISDCCLVPLFFFAKVRRYNLKWYQIADSNWNFPRKGSPMEIIDIKWYQLQAACLWWQGHRWHSRALWLLILNGEFGDLEATGQVERQHILRQGGSSQKRQNDW